VRGRGRGGGWVGYAGGVGLTFREVRVHSFPGFHLGVTTAPYLDQGDASVLAVVITGAVVCGGWAR